MDASNLSMGRSPHSNPFDYEEGHVDNDNLMDPFDGDASDTTPLMDGNNKQSDSTKKPTSAASFFNMVFSAAGLLSDGYQSGVLSFINLALGKIYGRTVFNDAVSSRLSYAMFVGCVVGQLVRGRGTVNQI